MSSLRMLSLRQLRAFSTSGRCRIDASIGATPENSLPPPSRFKRRRTSASQVASSRGPPILKSPATRSPFPEANIVSLKKTKSPKLEATTARDKPTAEAKAKASTTGTVPYHILRTPSQQLPVYRTVKRGGTLELTVIRKIFGDLTALRNDVQAQLGLPDDQISINTLTKQIKIKGYYKPQVEHFLVSKSF